MHFQYSCRTAYICQCKQVAQNRTWKRAILQISAWDISPNSVSQAISFISFFGASAVSQCFSRREHTRSSFLLSYLCISSLEKPSCLVICSFNLPNRYHIFIDFLGEDSVSQSLSLRIWHPSVIIKRIRYIDNVIGRDKKHHFLYSILTVFQVFWKRIIRILAMHSLRIAVAQTVFIQLFIKAFDTSIF